MEAWVSTNGTTVKLFWVWYDSSGAGHFTTCATSTAVWPAYVKLYCEFTVPSSSTRVAIGFGANAPIGKWAISDDWYMAPWPLHAGNWRGSGYGVRANITTPPSTPYVGPSNIGASSHVLGWVAAVGNGWLQTGWIYNPSIDAAHPAVYTESLIGGSHSGILRWGTTPWGSTYVYRVENVSGTSTWRAYLGNGQLDSRGPLPVPSQMQVMGETFGNSRNRINSSFTSVSWKNSSGSWSLFDSANWLEEGTYYVQDKSLKYQYYVTGGN
jgi:hypothetical protein